MIQTQLHKQTINDEQHMYMFVENTSLKYQKQIIQTDTLIQQFAQFNG